MLTAAIVHNHPMHYANLLFRELRRTGLDFEVLFTASSSAGRLESPPGGFPYRYACDAAYEAAPPLSVMRSVWASLSELGPRAVIIGGYCDAAAWSAWAWAELHRRPKILWAESNHFDRPRFRWKERVKSLFVRRCAAANVYGESSREYLAGLGMPRHRIATGRAVIDTDLFSHRQPRSGGRSSRLLLYVGRFAPEKNLELLLHVFARLARDRACPPIRLALVGYGPLEDRLRSLANDLRLWNAVEFWGPARQPELPALYGAADALVLPSLRETWGLVVLEAMACGLPVLVSSRCGCARDVVTAATGLTFDPTSADGTLAALRDLMCRPEAELDRMGQAASAIARQYSPENGAQLVIATLDALVKSDARLLPAPECTGPASLR
jgi:1,2-diacylglycerol 3-alpha-glucosyltransferase